MVLLGIIVLQAFWSLVPILIAYYRKQPHLVTWFVVTFVPQFAVTGIGGALARNGSTSEIDLILGIVFCVFLSGSFWALSMVAALLEAPASRVRSQSPVSHEQEGW